MIKMIREMKEKLAFAKDLLRYCRQELSPEEKERVQQVIAGNPELEELVRELMDKESVGEEIRLMAEFDTEKALRKVKGRMGRRIGYGWWAVAASVVLAVGVSLFFYLKPGEDKVPVVVAEEVTAGRARAILQTATGERLDLDTLSTVENAAGEVVFQNESGVLTIKGDEGEKVKSEGNNRVEVPRGGTYSLVLADGTTVYLNSGSSLEFPSRFSGAERRVKVNGEAYFEVKRDEAHPFVVSVGKMDVKVLGTSFNVKAYGEDPGIYTTLVEGRVAILHEGKAACELKPGEQSYYNKEVGNVTVREVETDVYTAWKDGMFYFKDMPLGEILKTVARWYDLEVFYVNAGVQGIQYSGKMPMYSSVEDVLRKFEISGDARFVLKGRTLTVYDR